MMQRLRRFPAFVGSLAVAFACLGARPAATPPDPPPDQAADYLYVCNQNGASITIVDAATLEVVQTLDLTKLGFSANAKPHHVVVEPDGSFWYVTLIGDNRVVKLSRDNKVVGQANFEVAGLLALLPDKDLLYVGRSMTAVNPPQRIGVIRTGDMSIDEIDVFFPRPHALDARPQGDFVYTASLGVNQMASVNVQTEELQLINVDGPTHALAHTAMSPDGSTLVITTHSNKLLVYDLADPARPRQVAAIDVPDQPWHPSYAPDGSRVYIPNNASNDVTIVDMRSRSVIRTIKDPRFAQPYGSAVSPDGRYLFVANNSTKPTTTSHEAHGGAAGATQTGNGTVSVIDTKTFEVVKVIPVGLGPTGLGIRRAR